MTDSDYPELAKAIKELEEVKAAKREAAKEFNEQIAALEKRIFAMADRALEVDDNEHLDFDQEEELPDDGSLW